jgi:hypothetical protein
LLSHAPLPLFPSSPLSTWTVVISKNDDFWINGLCRVTLESQLIMP